MCKISFEISEKSRCGLDVSNSILCSSSWETVLWLMYYWVFFTVWGREWAHGSVLRQCEQYLGQTFKMLDTTAECWGSAKWNKGRMGVFSGGTGKTSRTPKLPMLLKKKVLDQCVLPMISYGCQTLKITNYCNVQYTHNKLVTTRRIMKRIRQGIILLNRPDT